MDATQWHHYEIIVDNDPASSQDYFQLRIDGEYVGLFHAFPLFTGAEWFMQTSGARCEVDYFRVYYYADESFTVSDLQLACNADDSAPAVGDTIRIALALVDIGPGDATGNSIDVDLPDGLQATGFHVEDGYYDPADAIWNVPWIAAGDTLSLTIDAVVQPGTWSQDLVAAARILASDSLDPDASNNAASATVHVQPLPYEIVSVEPVRNPYHLGEVAVVDVVVRNNSGAGQDLHLVSNFFCIYGQSSDQYSGTTDLLAGQEYTFSVPCTLPIWDASVEYGVSVRLVADGHVVAQRISAGVFSATVLTDPELDAYGTQVGECLFDYETECTLQYINMLPLASSVSHALLFIENMCAAGELNRAGRTEEAWATFGVGLVEFGWVALNITTAGPDPDPAFVVLVGDGVGSAGQAALSCSDDLFTAGKELPAAGSLTDSLLGWYGAAVDSLDAPLADILFYEGPCRATVKADSAWATPDSTGLHFATVREIADRGGVCMVTSQVRAIGDAAEENPESACRFELEVLASGDIFVGLLHFDGSGGRHAVSFPAIPANAGERIAIDLDAATNVFRLARDADGDGRPEAWYYPDGTVSGLPEARPGKAAITHDAHPNPFNPMTTIRFELSESATVNLAVYDVAGRLVKQLLAHEARGYGRHEVVWDGRDLSGRSAASGLYFYRIETENDRATGRIVLIR